VGKIERYYQWNNQLRYGVYTFTGTPCSVSPELAVFKSILMRNIPSRKNNKTATRLLKKRKIVRKIPVLPKRKNNRIEPNTTISNIHIDLMLTFSSILCRYSTNIYKDALSDKPKTTAAMA
jgi:hypothetical protein